jgi:hypothetical protein
MTALQDARWVDHLPSKMAGRIVYRELRVERIELVAGGMN